MERFIIARVKLYTSFFLRVIHDHNMCGLANQKITNTAIHKL